MFKLKQKTKTASLSLALAAAMTGGVMMGTSTSVQAINIAQDGIGEVLVFPYYTVRDGWQTFFNITNTSAKTVMVRVRWHEGVNSRDVRDFNVTLSPYDVWTAATVAGTDDAGNEVAKIVTSDKTCTSPALNEKDGGRPGVLLGKNFTNIGYKGDGGGDSLDRTKEGYFTVIAMGVAKNENLDIPIYAKHVAVSGNGNKAVPFDCKSLNDLFRDNKLDIIRQDFGEPQNLIKGRAVLINAAKGVAMGYDPTVMANFYNPAQDATGRYVDGLGIDQPIIFGPDRDEPNLNFAEPSEASWINDTPGVGPLLQTITASQAQSASVGIGTGRGIIAPIDAVSVLFNRAAIVNDYNVATGSSTDWVVTLPTKRYYVDEEDNRFAGIPVNLGVAPLAPFDAAVSGEKFGFVDFRGNVRDKAMSCFDVSMRIWDREEGELTSDADLNFSPAPPPGEKDKFCYETNIISFGKSKNVDVDGNPISNVMGSKLFKSFGVEENPGLYGWGQLEFGGNGGESLPVVGMRLETRVKEGFPERSFGFANTHSYKRDVSAY